MFFSCTDFNSTTAVADEKAHTQEVIVLDDILHAKSAEGTHYGPHFANTKLDTVFVHHCVKVCGK